jgi:hypothetical protein
MKDSRFGEEQIIGGRVPITLGTAKPVDRVRVGLVESGIHRGLHVVHTTRTT